MVGLVLPIHCCVGAELQSSTSREDHKSKQSYLEVAFVALGLFLSLIFVMDTRQHVSLEAKQNTQTQNVKGFLQVFAITSWKNKTCDITGWKWSSITDYFLFR